MACNQCGQSCCNCKSCPPCDNQVPINCEPLEIAGTPTRILVEDSAFCKKTLLNPTTQSALMWDEDTEEIEWKDGSSSNMLCFPEINTISGGSATQSGLASVSSNGCISKFQGISNSGTFQLPFWDGVNNWVKFEDWNQRMKGVKGVWATQGVSSDQAVVIPTSGPNQYLQTNDAENLFFGPAEALGGSIGVSNLEVFTTTTSPGNSGTVNVGEIAVRTTTLNSIVLYPTLTGYDNLTFNVTVSGVGGLDSGTIMPNNYYFLYIIYNKTTGDINTIISANQEVPLLPSGYEYFKRVSAFKVNGSSLMVPYTQLGNAVFVAPQVFLNGVYYSVPTAVSLTSIVPPIANFMYGFWSTSGGDPISTFYTAGIFTQYGQTRTVLPGIGGTNFSAPIRNDTQEIYVWMDSGGLSPYQAFLTAWSLPL